jgi:CheY-like chemotaxis protein
MTGGKPQVLVVDDEPAQRRLMAESLRLNGYPVATAAHAREALDACAGPGGPPALLVTDVMMPPHCDGIELARILRRSYPGLKVLYVSAYAGDPRISEACRDARADFLPKPLNPVVLTQKAAELLGARSPSPGRCPPVSRGTLLMRVEEPSRRRWMREALQERGLWVLDAAHGSEALFIGRWHDGPIDLILTDPPGIAEGPFWVATLSEYRSGLEVLFVEEEGEGLRLRPLREPESIPELWKAVWQALAAAAIAPGAAPIGGAHSARNGWHR